MAFVRLQSLITVVESETLCEKVKVELMDEKRKK